MRIFGKKRDRKLALLSILTMDPPPVSFVKLANYRGPAEGNELTNDTRSSRNKHLCPYVVCFSVIKSCTYWGSSTLQALHEHAAMFVLNL